MLATERGVFFPRRERVRTSVSHGIRVKPERNLRYTTATVRLSVQPENLSCSQEFSISGKT